MQGIISSRLFREAAGAAQAMQVLLRLQYQQMRTGAVPLPQFADVEFRCYSQNGEDGILLYLFSLLGATSRKSVEICAGNGIECNTANLLVNHGWRGLLVDGDPMQIATGQAFYAQCMTTRFSVPTMVASWVTAENINALITEHGFAGDIDLLSLDVDGIDYWLWLALNCVRPRVVVVEFNALLGPVKRLTVPYSPDFRADLTKLPYKVGASLPAFVALARAKGYRLVGLQSLGFNAFFVQNGIAEDLLPEQTVADCFARTERLRDFGPEWEAAMFADGFQWEEV